MTRLVFLFFAAQFLLISCKEQPQQTQPITTQEAVPKLKEIVTKGYNVAIVDGQTVQDTLRQIQSITYDNQGREESTIYYNLKGIPQWRDVYQYDENNYKIGSTYYEGGENVITYKYEIDSQGRRIKYVAYDAKSATALYDGYSSYLDNGKVRKDGFKDNVGMIRWQYEYLFDEQQNELGYIYIDTKTGERFSSDYKTMASDSLGRWTKRGIYQNDTLRGIEERIYKY
jgi:hypothetical protein